MHPETDRANGVDLAPRPLERAVELEGLPSTEWTVTETALYAPHRNGSNGAGRIKTTSSAVSTRDHRSPEARYQEASEVLRKAIQQAEYLRREAQATHNAIVDRAHAEAEEIVDRATTEAAEILNRARAQSEPATATVALDGEADSTDVGLGLDSGIETDGAVSLLTAREISTREFPQVRRGIDPASVRKWLEVVELSYAILEEELDRARAEWERALETLARTRAYLVAADETNNGDGASRLTAELERARAQWERSVEILSRVRATPSRSGFQAVLVNASQFEASLRYVRRGYCPTQVGRLVGSLVTQLGRLQTQVDVLRAENEQLRDRILWQVADPSRFTRPSGRRTVTLRPSAE